MGYPNASSASSCIVALLFLANHRVAAWSPPVGNDVERPRSFPRGGRSGMIFGRPSTAVRLAVYNDDEGDDDVSLGIYRPFVEHAWSTLESSGLLDTAPTSLVPPELAQNSAPSRGDTSVRIEVRAAPGASSSALRLARHALLHTVDDGADSTVPSGIHVLNLVLFPAIARDDVPIFGADLVTLPGNKHLIVIDLQPFLLEHKDDPTKGELRLPNEKLQTRLEKLHARHVVDNAAVLPWGGEIPDRARRYFSPYALWTRLGDASALDLVQTEVYAAFVDYLELYVDVLKTVSSKNNVRTPEELTEGHASYLHYRRVNDPARPMLQRLYGEAWTERLIREVLFQDILL